MTRTLRLVLAAALLAALTGATSRGCVPEAGTAPNGGRPGTHTYKLRAEGTPRRAHVYAKVGSFVHIDELRNLPWGKTVTARPNQDVTLNVSLVDVLSTKDAVTCTILNTAGEELDRDGPNVVAKCYLLAIEQPA
jgi:hypothetical protein